MPKSTSSALGKALDILDVIARADRPLRLTDLSQEIGLHRATIHRVIAELVDRGWVLRVGNHYLPGAAALQLSKSATQSSLVQLAQPLMQRLSQRTSMMVNLQVLEATGSRVLHVECPPRLHMIAQLEGELLFVHRFAGPLTFVATLDESARAPYLTPAERDGFPMGGDDGLIAEIERTERRGYALERSRNEVGIGSASIAVVSDHDEPMCALTIVGPVAEFSDTSLPALISELSSTCDRLGEELQHALSAPRTHRDR